MAHTCNASTREVKAKMIGSSKSVPQLHRELNARLSYMRPCFKLWGLHETELGFLNVGVSYVAWTVVGTLAVKPIFIPRA